MADTMVMRFALPLLCVILVGASSPTTRIFHRHCVKKHCHSKNKRTLGSHIRLKAPTADRVTRWFRRDGYTACNHETPGMTNPCLHISLVEREAGGEDSVVQVFSSGNNNDWWPESRPKEGWKLLRYRKRVGRGAECYNVVRDRALEWEFGDESTGILQVHSPISDRLPIFQRREDSHVGYDVVHNVVYGDGDLYSGNCENAHKIWSGMGGRRLVTYTRPVSLKWLPRLYVVNPVSVVYDLVDERAPGTTYSCTAYATARGHWMRGEERVSVLHRDATDTVDVEIISYSKPAPNMWGRMIWPFIGRYQSRFFERQITALEDVARSNVPTRESSPRVINVNSRRCKTSTSDSCITR